jgi:hypothetical protein
MEMSWINYMREYQQTIKLVRGLAESFYQIPIGTLVGINLGASCLECYLTLFHIGMFFRVVVYVLVT